MASKQYFIKYSYVDSSQPLLRLHHNDIVFLDLSIENGVSYFHDSVKLQVGLERYMSVDNFVIDFMIETGN